MRPIWSVGYNLAMHRLRDSTATSLTILYHFDQVFTILEILVSEKADKFSFELRQILKRPVFSAVTRD